MVLFGYAIIPYSSTVSIPIWFSLFLKDEWNLSHITDWSKS